MAMPKSNTKKLKDKLWKLVSEYVRRRHATSEGYVECYTCGKVDHWKNYDAGHGIPGRKNMVLFDLEVLRAQCKGCNRNQGEQFIFGTKLDEENGPGWFEMKLINSRKPRKIYDYELEEMIESIESMLEEL